MEDMREYHDMYLKTDVLLLTDLIENFRKMCKGNYGLDLCHHISSAGLAWDAMLKMTRIELELLTDIDKFFFIEKGMRGGISYIARRHGKANNKQVEGYDESKPTKHISIYT